MFMIKRQEIYDFEQRLIVGVRCMGHSILETMGASLVLLSDVFADYI